MSGDQQYLEALRQLGLDKYEAQVCVALYTQGPLTPSELSQRSGVPKSWVYSVLKSLAAKGWVESGQGRPRLFRPVPISSLLPRIRTQLSENVEKTLRLLEELGSRGGEPSEAISALVYYGEKQVASKAEQLASASPRAKIVLNHYWARRLRISPQTRVLVWAKQHSLLVLGDSVFWFIRTKELPAIGVLAFSKPLALMLGQLVLRQQRLGALKPLRRPQHGWGRRGAPRFPP